MESEYYPAVARQHAIKYKNVSDADDPLKKGLHAPTLEKHGLGQKPEMGRYTLSCVFFTAVCIFHGRTRHDSLRRHAFSCCGICCHLHPCGHIRVGHRTLLLSTDGISHSDQCHVVPRASLGYKDCNKTACIALK